MPSKLPDSEPGIHRDSVTEDSAFFSEPSSRVNPTYPQVSFDFDLNERRKGVTFQLYAVVGAMFRAWAKGRRDPYGDWAKALNRKPSYASKLHEALHRQPERFIQLDHIGPFFECPEAETIWIEFNCELCHREPPVKKREITAEEDARAEHEVISELPEPLQEMIRREKAKKLGVRLEDLKR